MLLRIMFDHYSLVKSNQIVTDDVLKEPIFVPLFEIMTDSIISQIGD